MRFAHGHLAGLAIVALVACTERPTVGEAARVEVAVAALDLPGVTNAVYTITVRNESGEIVWTRQADADGYGDGAGGLSLVGPCDADDDPNDDGDATNTVELVLDSLLAQSAPLTAGVDYVNPAPAGSPLSRPVVCEANADTLASYDLTVVRRAQQGFFDVAVSFSDVFCSAKLDCRDALLHNDDGVRDTTVILALACTGGAGTDTHLYLDPIDIDCGVDGALSILPTGPKGNQGPVAPWVFEHALYYGVEQLESGGESLSKVYWNVAIGVDEEALDAAVACTLEAAGTASPARFTDGVSPAGATWPEITWDVELKAAGSPTLTCTSHALGGAGGDVVIGYQTDRAYPYELVSDLANGGAGATAGDSGASTPPSWVTGPDLGTLAYATTLNVSLEAADVEGGVTYSSPDLPSWLSLHPTTGALTGGTLDQAEFGSVSFDVVADDGVFTVTETFSLFVQHPADCDDIKRANGAETGVTVREIDPSGVGTGIFEVVCDMDTWGGGWTLVVAQFEDDPAGDWAEGRQGDYDPSLASGAGFALAGGDVPGHDQVAIGGVRSNGGAGFVLSTQDYLDFVYDPAADYDNVDVVGLATHLPMEVDRAATTYHGWHDPEQGTGTTPDWFDTLTFDFYGGRGLTWAFAPNHAVANERGYARLHNYRGDIDDQDAWAVWVRDGSGIDSPPAGPPTSCAGYTGLSGTSVQVIDPTGSSALPVLCNFDSWGGNWTLVALQFELNPIAWNGGRGASYSPTARWNAASQSGSFALTGADLPPHGEVAFGRVLADVVPTFFYNDLIDYVDFVYNPAASYGEVLVAGKATSNSYHIDRHTSAYHGNHDPESSTGNTAVWNYTLTFDKTGGVHQTWSFSPQQTTASSRGYGFLGNRNGSSEPYGWAVWVR